MKIVIFCHSLLSDWNHGNAHFLRGITTELIERGHEVFVYEPRDSWSLNNLLQDAGASAVEGFLDAYPELDSLLYNPGQINLHAVLHDADLVIVHEWNDPALVSQIGKHRQETGDYLLLFHDTHHRAVTDKRAMASFDLSGYDGALVFGQVLKDIYTENRWVQQAWVWHEAADTRIFRPISGQQKEGDLVWIGNWGDNERSEELRQFLMHPVSNLGLRAKVYGVRYPSDAIRELEKHGIEYGGYLPNYRAPEVYAKYSVTVHIPRRPYAQSLPGIPTIRVFEALACGIPLVSTLWTDSENLFRPGEDFLIASNGDEMELQLHKTLSDPIATKDIVKNGQRQIKMRHTCQHRVDQLLEIFEQSRSGKELHSAHLT